MKKCSPEKLAILSYATRELNERNALQNLFSFSINALPNKI